MNRLTLRQLNVFMAVARHCNLGQAAEELALTGKRWDVYDIARFFEEEFFETKKVVYTPKK